jgi:hypothetical protein
MDCLFASTNYHFIHSYQSRNKPTNRCALACNKAKQIIHTLSNCTWRPLHSRHLQYYFHILAKTDWKEHTVIAPTSYSGGPDSNFRPKTVFVNFFAVLIQMLHIQYSVRSYVTISAFNVYSNLSITVQLSNKHSPNFFLWWKPLYNFSHLEELLPNKILQASERQ